MAPRLPRPHRDDVRIALAGLLGGLLFWGAGPGTRPASEPIVLREGRWPVLLPLAVTAGCELLRRVRDGEQAVALARELRPDLVLMDIQMPRLDGVSATRQVVSEQLADVLVLTTFDLDEYVFGALRAGASGFLLKNTEARDLIEAVRTVARGEGLIAPAVTRRLIAEFATRPAREPRADPAVLGTLTRREREVLSCLGEGLSNAGIAARLDMAEATVKTHVSRILGKLELRSRVQAAVLAQELGV
ncbi:response regulator transcription factor [Streptomyces sp. ADMS]|uniref:response regulator transcription factor n=1 Tax=Streptomyces sp. ADMS TaxID=3071415 RepID=UPI00296E49F0|nr:response regulator transcription factor [Streptomyces sp. ADMS]MDW4904553.1 response regulator transcription factor [Streptomyces sp. ADMS]